MSLLTITLRNYSQHKNGDIFKILVRLMRRRLQAPIRCRLADYMMIRKSALIEMLMATFDDTMLVCYAEGPAFRVGLRLGGMMAISNAAANRRSDHAIIAAQQAPPHNFCSPNAFYAPAIYC